jgi:aldehyde:ferredoxin oxidoreductase
MALVHVDLGAGGVRTDATAAGRAEDGWGGPIAGLRVLLRAVARPPATPADAPVALLAGAVGGVAGPGLARVAAVGLSPLSGGVAETRAEGPFARGLRGAGVTGLVVHGRAPQPVCVVVERGRVRLEPAGHLWGLETGAATDALLDEYGPAAAVAVIGPAGEHGVRYASVVTCRDHPLPRLGFGAVLGAKRVKAVVCLGDEEVPVADPAGLARIGAAYARAVPGNRLAALQHGTSGFAVWTGEPGYATVANFTDTATRSGVDPATAPVPQRVAACPGCPTDCMKVYAGAALHQEALAMLGPNIGCPDPWTLHARCLQLGLDSVSLGGTLAAARIAPERIGATVEAIAHGHDRDLGQGAAALVRAGRAADQAMTSKGVELPPFDPRVQPNLGLAWAVSPIGPRYDIVEHDLDFVADGLTESFAEARRLGLSVPRVPDALDPAGTAILMRLWSGLDALGVCLFAATPTRPLALADVEDLVAAVTGERPDVLALGDRRLRLQRAVNRRLGIGLDADTLPGRFFTEPLAAGPWSGAVLDRDAFTAAVAALHRELCFDTELGFGTELAFDTEVAFDTTDGEDD